jgi:hypothetical protein
MGSKPIIALLPLIRPVLKPSGFALVLALLAGCISDGPNRTGGQYLENQDIRFQNPLYHVVLPNFPVDSVWTLDPDVVRASDSILMLGTSGTFEGQVRLAFDMADTNFLDSLRSDSSDFRLSVGPYLSTGAGMVELIKSVGDSGAESSEIVRDSITILVESWAVLDRGTTGLVLTKDQRTDTVNRYNSRFMTHWDPTPLLAKPSAMDTIKLQTKGAYVKNKLQARSLKNFHRVLRGLAGSPKILVHLQLTALPDLISGAPGLLRLDNRYASVASQGSHHGPALLFGSSSTTAITATTKQQLSPIITSRGGVFYVSGSSKLIYNGLQTDLVPARERSLHLILNRDKLLDSINAFLRKSGITPPPASISGKFDITYFVPFAKINIPVDTQRLEGQFPMEFVLRSDLDSILPEPPANLRRVKSFSLNKPEVLLNLYSRTEPNKVIDTLSILFQKPTRSISDSNFLQVIIRHNSDSTKSDSIYIGIDETKEKTIGYSQGYPSLKISMVAKVPKDSSLEKAELTVSYYLTNPGANEENGFRDPETGKLLTTLSERLSKLNLSLLNGITLRATRGLQMLLNRADAGDAVAPELVLQTGLAIDTAAVISGKTSPEFIPYPVLTVIPPKLIEGKLTVDLDFYLYPLKQEL